MFLLNRCLLLIAITVSFFESEDLRFFTTAAYLTTTKYFYVVPSANKSLCPWDNATSCHTLEEYAAYEAFSDSDASIFLFLSGVHSLNQTLIVNDAAGLTLKGMSDYKAEIVIVCTTWNIGIQFIETYNVTIDNIKICNCSQFLETNNGTNVSSALFFQGGYNLTINCVTLINGGLYVGNVLGQVIIRKSRITSYLQTKVLEQSLQKYHFQSFGGSYFIYQNCTNDMNKLVVEEFTLEFYNKSILFNISHVDLKRRPSGVQLLLYCTNVQVIIQNSSFSGYKGLGDGGNLALILQNNSHIYEYPVTISNSRFEHGYAMQGGGAYISLVQVSTVSSFKTATYGRSYNIVSFDNVTFLRNSAFSGGGAVCFKEKESFTSHSIQLINFHNCIFLDNYLRKIGHGGIAIYIVNYMAIKYLYHPNPQFKTTISDCTFQGNYVPKYDYCSAGNGVILVTHSSYFMVRNSTLTNNNCTAITAVGTNLVFEGDVIISYNRGASGGGINFCENSVMFLKPYTNVTIAHNAVVHAGGGICVEALCLQSKPMCFYQLDNETAHNISLLDTISVNLIQNNATKYAGSNLFGGSVDNCYIIDSPDYNSPPIWSLHAFRHIFTFNPALNLSLSFSGVTSIPRKICFCENGKQNCSWSEKHVSAYPGETFSIEAVPVGQLNGTVPGSIRAFCKNEANTFKQYERVQKISKPQCSNLSYTIMSNKSSEVLYLRIQHDGDISGYERTGYYKALPLTVYLKDCPIGFSLQRNIDHGVSQYYCECSKVLLPENTTVTVSKSCSIANQSIQVSFGWIGYISDPVKYKSDVDKFFVYMKLCPLRICKPFISIKSDKLNDSSGDSEDPRCLYNRTGILCGSCRKNLSVILGTSDCWVCSNSSLALLPLFAFAGIFLILFLSIFNFTIADGSLSGLIFYANIIQIGEPYFFPSKQMWYVSFLRVFISWLNLDFGIAACFYNGMDAYAKAWLQFVFPLYIWSLSVLIIYLCRRYIFFTKIVGPNSVKVLATLILLSYSKMLRTIVATMSFVVLPIHYEAKVHRRLLWMYDASIPFLLKHSRHIPLFIIGLLFSLLCFPFMIFMLFIQCTPKLSRFKGFHWIERLKPFFDTYTGANTRQGRFWTGLLLLCRTYLSIIANMNLSHGSLIYITHTSLVCLFLLLIAHCLPSGVFTKHKYNMLESFFLVNLVFLCVLSAYIKANNASQWHQSCSVGISVTLTLFIFVGFVFIHIWKRIETTLIGISLRLLVMMKVESLKTYIRGSSQHSLSQNNHIGQHPPIAQFNEFREPLLESGSFPSYSNNN